MRFCDWDILLFPSGEGVEGAHIPIREFKTQCQGEQRDGRHAELSPLMSCFVPSLMAGANFQISVHSWSNTRAIWPPAADGHQLRELWEVRVVVDGEVNTMAHLPVDAQWPQIISQATHENGQELAEHRALRFPPFHSELKNERSWQAADMLGRIRVELSAGFHDEKHGGFAKTENTVTFTFQHAPIKILELAGIAWPSREMYMHPLPRAAMAPPQVGHSLPAATISQAPHAAHRKMPSIGSLQIPMIGGPQQFAGPFNPYQSHPTNFDPTSRSTSAYSTLSASAGPIIPNNFSISTPQQNGTQANSPRDSQFQFRLPSDQLAQIIHALNPNKQESQMQSSAESMPPPPLPMHANQFRPDATLNGHYAPGSKMQRTDLDQLALNAIDRRAASNSGYSDISMHPSCNNFPQCISEDPNGCLVHENTGMPPAPVAVVKGKKEGSSATKPRDFLSVALDAPAASVNQGHPPPPPMTLAPKDLTMNPSPAKEVLASSLLSDSPADANGKKRTRSALKALNINDSGSPQKADANKPARKASRASTSSVKSTTNESENVSDQFLVEHPHGLENQEMLDA